MKKNNKKANTLIKRKKIISMMQKGGIKRINKEAILFLEKNIEEYLFNLIDALKEEITIQGRKTLKKEDCKNVLNKIKKQEAWEI